MADESLCRSAPQVGGELLSLARLTDDETLGHSAIADILRGVATSDLAPLQMKLDGLHGRQPLQAVLSAMTLPGQTLPLQDLHLSECQLPPAGMHGCSSLASLTKLSLQGCSSPAGSFDATLAALLPQMPQPQRLHVERCLQHGDPFPDSLRILAGPTLTLLDLSSNNLSDLPQGPCWEGKQLRYSATGGPE